MKYMNLFSNNVGFLSLSASSEGEYAWSDDNNGGYFTHYFIKESLSKDPSETWSENFVKSRQKVMQMFNRMPSEQKTELLNEGIESQTPKAYSLPVALNGATPIIPSPPVRPELPLPNSASISAEINIINNTGNPISYFIEVPSSDGEYIIDEYEGALASKESMSLSEISIIYFQSNGSEIGYVIDSGSYIFKLQKFGGVDLYPHDEVNSEDYHSPYTASELSDLMIGQWEYELSDESVYFEFYGDGSYEIFDDEDYILEEGIWIIYEETIDGEVYYTLELESDDGYLDEFDVYTEDGYMIELLSLTDSESEVEFLYAAD